MPTPWYVIDREDVVTSPALLVYPDRMAENIRRMVAMAGRPDRLRPHLKTTKLPQVVQGFLAHGVDRFKVATIAEAEMAARSGAPDVLLGYQPVGPNIGRLIDLMAAFPATRFLALTDDDAAMRALSAAAVTGGVTIPLLLDLDTGMHRSGVPPGPRAAALYAAISSLPGLEARGLHVYDGHLRDRDGARRAAQCDEEFAPVQALREALSREGRPVPLVVAGGSPTFPAHARRPDVECSPGTLVFSDLGTARNFPDLDFLHAALVFTRVVSHPGAGRLCVDLGHKAVAAENPHPRVEFLNLPDARAVGHSEEHLVLETPRAAAFPVGASLYGLPWHICPTVALHDEAVIVREGAVVDRWPVTARTRKISV
jgi:D-serine deaminase-like pyridoxal phosphate-dependent protein